MDTIWTVFEEYQKGFYLRIMFEDNFHMQNIVGLFTSKYVDVTDQ
jgi:hypothetical protein